MIRRKSDRNEFAKLLDFAAVGLLVLTLLVAFTQFAHAKAYSSSQDFVQKATIGGLFEVQTSQLALQRSQNDSVKAFAQKMIDDHTKANNDLQALLPSTTVDPKSINQALDPPHQKMLDKLTAASDKDFDGLYIHLQKKAHHEAIDLFSDYAKSGDDATLKTFAAQTLPELQNHKKEIADMKMTTM